MTEMAAGGPPVSVRGIPSAWAQAWRDPAFRVQTLVALVALPVALEIAARFFDWIELRPGVELSDPILALLTPHNLTWLTFTLVYGAIGASALRLARHPPNLVYGMQAYALMVVFRMLAMWLVPLNAPPGMILLVDPLVETLGTGKALSKDLFFSGHTATLYLMFLLEDDKRVKPLYLAGTLAIAACVLVQHVHYSFDVLAAPLFADAAYRIVRRFRAA